MSGISKIRTRSLNLILTPPTISLKNDAAEYYRDVWQECKMEGLMDEEDALKLLRQKGVWKEKDEEEYDLLNKKIDDMKVGLFENWARSNVRFQIRHALSVGKKEIIRLENIRHSLDHVTCEGIAGTSKVRYLTGFSLHHTDGRAIFQTMADWEDMPDNVLDDVIDYLAHNRLLEAEIRELSRNDPWKSYWSVRKVANKGVFDSFAYEMTDDQRYLCMWSNLYENIRENPDCPEDSVVEDDDMLDGWMIKQKRERDAQRAKKKGDEIENEKIRNADGVFIMADTLEDARKIEELNSEEAKYIKSQRLSYLKQKGQVTEADMPDTRLRYQMEMIQKQMKG